MVKPAPPPVHFDEAETIRQLVEGHTTDRKCGGLHQGLPCDHEAVWWHDCTGCGSFMPRCEGHREWLDRRVANGARYRCVRCDTPTPVPIVWSPL